MMENPFFRSHRNSYRSPFNSPIQSKNPSSSSSRKVVSIPVHFVDSDKTKQSSALKIEKVFRGFLVRKSVKKIIALKTEVDKIEHRVSQRQTIGLIREKDSKERLKLNEMLMAALIRLDSVRGVDSGVRDLRKSVIRKAIRLQERIDAIVAGDLQEEDQTLDETTEGKIEGRDAETENLVGEIVDSSQLCTEEEKSVDQTLKMQAESDSHSSAEGAVESTVNHNDSSVEQEEVIIKNNDPMLVSGTEATTGIIRTEGLEKLPEELGEKLAGEEIEDQPEDTIAGKGGQIVNGCDSSVMEKMIEKNEKLMGLVTELCEKNDLQTQMISTLSQRVGFLERAFKCGLSRRKKKRQPNAGMDKEEVKKCGRKS